MVQVFSGALDPEPLLGCVLDPEPLLGGALDPEPLLNIPIMVYL